MPVRPDEGRPTARSTRPWSSCGTHPADPPVRRGRDFLFAEIDIFSAKRIGDGVIKTAFIDKAAVHHCLDDGFAIQVCLVQNVLGLRGLKNALLDKEFGDLFLVH